MTKQQTPVTHARTQQAGTHERVIDYPMPPERFERMCIVMESIMGRPVPRGPIEYREDGRVVVIRPEGWK